MNVRLVSIPGLLALAALSRADFDVSFSISSDRRIDNAIVGFSSADAQHQGAALLGGFDAGSYAYDVTVPGAREQYASYSYGLVATYLASGGTEGLVVSLRPDVARFAIGREFSSVFTGADEASVVASVKGAARGDFFAAYRLGSFFMGHRDLLPLGESGGTLVGFSNGRVVGSIDPVPEPAPVAALALGLAALSRRRRGQAKNG